MKRARKRGRKLKREKVACAPCPKGGWREEWVQGHDHAEGCTCWRQHHADSTRTRRLHKHGRRLHEPHTTQWLQGQQRASREERHNEWEGHHQVQVLEKYEPREPKVNPQGLVIIRGSLSEARGEGMGERQAPKVH
jgi:hypothetical protein